MMKGPSIQIINRISAGSWENKGKWVGRRGCRCLVMFISSKLRVYMYLDVFRCVDVVNNVECLVDVVMSSVVVLM